MFSSSIFRNNKVFSFRKQRILLTILPPHELNHVVGRFPNYREVHPNETEHPPPSGFTRQPRPPSDRHIDYISISYMYIQACSAFSKWIMQAPKILPSGVQWLFRRKQYIFLLVLMEVNINAGFSSSYTSPFSLIFHLILLSVVLKRKTQVRNSSVQVQDVVKISRGCGFAR